MFYRKNPIHIIWLIPYLLVFGFGVWFFLNRIQTGINDPRFNNLFEVSLLAFLIFAFSVLYLRFRLEIGDTDLTVQEIFRRTDVPFSDLGAIFVRQTPIQRMLGLKSILIELKDPKWWKSTTIKAFGVSIKGGGARTAMPGRWGGLVSIPSVTIEEANTIINTIKSKVHIVVTDVGMGYPYNDPIIRLLTLFTYGFFGLLLLSFFFWLYLSIKTNGG